MTELDGFQSLKGVRVLCATNYPSKILVPFIRRFSSFIHVAMPKRSARKAALALYLEKNKPHQVDFSEVADSTEGRKNNSFMI